MKRCIANVGCTEASGKIQCNLVKINLAGQKMMSLGGKKLSRLQRMKAGPVQLAEQPQTKKVTVVNAVSTSPGNRLEECSYLMHMQDRQGAQPSDCLVSPCPGEKEMPSGYQQLLHQVEDPVPLEGRVVELL